MHGHHGIERHIPLETLYTRRLNQSSDSLTFDYLRQSLGRADANDTAPLVRPTIDPLCFLPFPSRRQLTYDSDGSFGKKKKEMEFLTALLMFISSENACVFFTTVRDKFAK